MLSSTPHRQSAPRPRWFLPALLGIFLLGSFIRAALYRDYVTNNPLAAHPIVDAQTYWNWAGRIAAGQWTDGAPFFSAPLYPYWLGALRGLGVGLDAVYLAQIAMDLLAAMLLACLARLRFGYVAGLLAAAIYLLLLEPASFSLRILACTPQLLLIATALLLLHALAKKATLARGAAAGVAIGLFALTYPPALILIPILAAACWWTAGRTRRALGPATALLIGGALAIAPATWHNYRACGEFIPISAQAGLTFAQGNAPGAEGTYRKLPDVSTRREDQNTDAWRACERAAGRTPTWNGVNDYFFRRGLDYWRSDPRAALELAGRKAWWFVAGQNYNDIYWPAFEADEGLTTRFRWTPLQTAWLIPIALIAAGAWLRRAREHLPELLFLALPAAVCVAFFYSPRYRLPALPVLVLGTAYVLSRALAGERRRAWGVAAATGAVVAGGFGLMNRATGFDRLDPYRGEFRCAVGTAWSKSGHAVDLPRAIEWYEKALAADPNLAEAHANLGDTLARRGDAEAALRHLQVAVQGVPGEPVFHDQLGRVLAQLSRLPEAVEQFRAAIALNPHSAPLRNNLGNALLLMNDVAGAAEQYRAALEIDPASAEAHCNLGRVLATEGRIEPADEHFREALRFKPDLPEALLWHGRISIERGDMSGGLTALRKAHALAPADETVLNELAWTLATAPGLSAADRAQSLELAQRAVMQSSAADSQQLDTLAAAQAATGRFDDAVRTLNRALVLARQRGDTRLAEQFQARLELYRAKKPYVRE